jgi:hypothetical protein
MAGCHLTILQHNEFAIVAHRTSSSMQLRDEHQIMPSAAATDPTLRLAPVNRLALMMTLLSCWIRPVTKISLFLREAEAIHPVSSQRSRTSRLCHHATLPKSLVLPGSSSQRKLGYSLQNDLEALRPKITLNTETNKMGSEKRQAKRLLIDHVGRGRYRF